MGEVGRPDLAVRPEATVQDEAAILFASLKKLKALDGAVRVYPGHGSGSACGKAIGAGDFCSIENQKIKNNMFKITDEA